MIQNNLDTQEVWNILETFSLDDIQKNILKTSFRTRAKYKAEDDILEFQFKFVPNISQKDIEEIESVTRRITPMLQKYFGDQSVEVSFKVAECCEKDCFCCETYMKKLASSGSHI